MKNNLEWKTIYYFEELDTDGSLLTNEWAEEAEYRNGYLVKSVHIDIEKNIRHESLTFCQK
jgi:hypothetical protein